MTCVGGGDVKPNLLTYLVTQYKLAVLTFGWLHGTAPSYLADEFLRSMDHDARGQRHHHHRSFVVLCRSYRVFPVTSARVWNELPRHVMSAPSRPRVCWQSSEDSSFRAGPFPTFCEATQRRYRTLCVTYLLTAVQCLRAANAVTRDLRTSLKETHVLIC